MQNDYEEFKFAIDAAKKALADIDLRRSRQKREGDPSGDIEEVSDRLDEIGGQETRIDSISLSLRAMLKEIKGRVTHAREVLKG